MESSEKIKQLEQRIEELERRPVFIPYPVPYPVYPTYPTYPTLPVYPYSPYYTVTYGAGSYS